MSLAPVGTSEPRPPQRQRNQRGAGSRLRDEVIEAAMRLLDSAPSRTLSLRMVAKEAGVAPPSLYRQFADADTMMGEIIVTCWQHVGAEMIAAGETANDRAPLAALQAQMGAFVRYAMLRPSRYQLLFALPIGSDAELVGPLRPVYRVVLETIERHVLVGGHLPLDSAAASALLSISLAHGRIALAHLAPTRPGNVASDVERFVVTSLGRLFTQHALPPLCRQA